MRLLLVVALVLSAGVAEETPGEARAGGESSSGRGWVVVRKDGARVTFDGPPRTEGRRLVGRLPGSGTLVSIPVARVDAEATARENAPGEKAAAPPAAPAPRPFETPPIGQRVRLTMSAEDARRLLEETRTGTPAPGPLPSETPSTSPLPVRTDPTDRSGRDESYWRDRASVARRAAEEAERELTAAAAALEAAERAYLGGSEGERTTFVRNVLEARDRMAFAREEHGRARARWDALQEEARKAGAYPGWLR